MLHTQVSEEHSVIFLSPETDVEKKDFQQAAEIINTHIGDGFPVSCVMVHVEKYEPWDKFGKLCNELTLDDDQHEWLTHIAIVTDNPTGDASKHMAEHFKNAKIQIYSYCEYDQAHDWLHACASGVEQGMESDTTC